jgi:radical SAM superfamily enzyme YgiQ (UPF0313 family)
MNSMPFRYIEPLFRPPSEARSLILQVTNGCSYNQCSFCEMYSAPQKKFSTRIPLAVMREIEQAGQLWPGVRRVFLADGDAMVLSARRLQEVLGQIRLSLPKVNRVSAYCLPRNLKHKTVAELRALRESGLGLLYVGAESGDDEVLARVNKGESHDSTLEALHKIKEAGIKVSVMLLNGLGGQQLSQQHALNSAKLINAAQPEYLATLVLSFPEGESRFRATFPDYQPLDQHGLFREMETLLAHTELENTIFRSDHASNYLILKGVLGRDRARLLEQVRVALADPLETSLRPGWMRGF